jgi:hypothetical protein
MQVLGQIPHIGHKLEQTGTVTVVDSPSPPREEDYTRVREIMGRKSRERMGRKETREESSHLPIAVFINHRSKEYFKSRSREENRPARSTRIFFESRARGASSRAVRT